MSDYWADLAWPADAVRRQLVLLYVLLGAVALSTLLAVLFASRAFFTAAHQLREIAHGRLSWRGLSEPRHAATTDEDDASLIATLHRWEHR